MPAHHWRTYGGKMKKYFIASTTILCLFLSGCSLSQKRTAQYESTIEDLQNTIKELQLQIDELQKQNQLLEESISRFSDYRINIKDKYIISKNGNKVLLNDYEYFEEIPNGKKIKYLFRSENNGVYTYYFFNSSGIQINKFVLDSGYEFPRLTFSPNEKYFILDDGTSPIRNIDIFEYETLKKIKTLTTLRSGFWFNDKFYYNSFTENGAYNYSDDVHNMSSFISCYNPENKEIEEITKCSETKCSYFLSFSGKTVPLYYKYYDTENPYEKDLPYAIKEIPFNLLDCSFKKALVNDNSVRIRSDSDTNSKIINELNKNEIVTILSRTEIEYKIDSFIDYWYLIHDKEGNIGYMYGAYLDIQE